MREEFHADIERLSARLVDNAVVCDEMLKAAVLALVRSDVVMADAVVARDREVDQTYLEVEHTLLSLLALQAPVASDLRSLCAIQHVNLHVERMGDYATQIARTAGRVSHLDGDGEVADLFLEMGSAAVDVSRAALRSFVTRDPDAARAVAVLDDRVDRLNLAIFRRLVGLGTGDPERFAWGTHLIVAARSLERYGDHGVDVAERTIFAVTGQIVELSSNDPHAGGPPAADPHAAI